MAKRRNFNMLASGSSKNDGIDDFLEKYLKYTKEEAVLDNLLLGSFVGDQYIIADEIKKELVENDKILTEWFEDGANAELKVKDVTLKFNLKINDFDEKNQIATLYLIEKVYNENIESFIADYVDEKSEFFKGKAMLALNIVLEYQENEKSVDDEILKKIENSKGKNTSDRKFVVEMYSELYVLRMLKILKNSGELGKSILDYYYKKIKERGYDGAPTPGLYIKLRRTLDEAIEKNGGLKALAKKNEDVKFAAKEFVDSIDSYKKVADVVAAPSLDKNSGGKNSNKSAAKDSSGGKKKGSDSKGKSDKKTDKKKNKKDDKKKEIKGHYIKPKEEEKEEPPQETDTESDNLTHTTLKNYASLLKEIEKEDTERMKGDLEEIAPFEKAEEELDEMKKQYYEDEILTPASELSDENNIQKPQVLKNRKNMSDLFQEILKEDEEALK